MTRWANENAYNPEIAQAHQAFRAVPASVIKAIIAAESGFDKNATRAEPHINDASRGLMQLLSSTARGLGYYGTADNLLLPSLNLYYGTKLLDQLIAKTGNWDDAISAYNGGIRPEIGYGKRATRIIRGICQARDSRGNCTRRVDVPAGQYANQTYVDRVKGYLQYFNRAAPNYIPTVPMGTPDGDVTTPGGVGLAVLIGLAGAYVATRGN